MNIVIKGKLLLSNRHPSASVTLFKVMTFLSLHIFHDNWLLQDQISAHLVTTFWKFQHKVILGFGWLSIKVPLPMQCWSISLYTIHRCWPQGHFLINLPEAKLHYAALLSKMTTSGIVFFPLDYQLPTEAVLFLPLPVVTLRLVSFFHLDSVENVFLYNNVQCFHKFNSIK